MITKEFQADTGSELDVRIFAGRVEIRSGESGVVRVEVETHDSGFVVEQRGDQIRVHRDRTTGWSSSGSDYVVISTGDKLDVTVTTASANIECHTPLGDVSTKTSSGATEVHQAKSVMAKSASGDITLGTVSNDVTITTASGDVVMETAGGKSHVSAASGDIHIHHGSGSVVASTASGDISIDRFEGHQAILKTISGEADVGIPAGTKVDLDATLMSGKLVTPPPIASIQPGNREMTLRAKLVSGNLTIRRVEA